MNSLFLDQRNSLDIYILNVIVLQDHSFRYTISNIVYRSIVLVKQKLAEQANYYLAHQLTVSVVLKYLILIYLCMTYSADLKDVHIIVYKSNFYIMSQFTEP